MSVHMHAVASLQSTKEDIGKLDTLLHKDLALLLLSVYPKDVPA